jgi:hypothetical protein
MTTANGTYRDCGWGEFYVSITCSGLSCDAFRQFPGLTCTKDGVLLKCDNGILYDNPNITSTFSLTQPDKNVSSIQKLTIDNKMFLVQQDFTGHASMRTASKTTPHFRRPRSLGLLTIFLVFFLFGGVLAVTPPTCLPSHPKAEILTIFEANLLSFEVLPAPRTGISGKGSRVWVQMCAKVCQGTLQIRETGSKIKIDWEMRVG